MKKKILIFFIIIIFIIPLIYMNKNIEKREEKIPNEESKGYMVSWNNSSEMIEIKNNYKANISLDDKNKIYIIDLVVDIVNDSEDEWNRIYFRDYPSAFTNEENGNISEIT